MRKFLIFVFSFLLISFVLGEATLAATDAGQSSFQFKPQVQIPGTDFAYPEVTLMTGDAIGSYIVSLYKYGAGIAGLVALFMIVLAGWKWLMAAGNSEKISTAKDTIQGALIGLFLLFGGYLLLSQISTSLVEFNTLNLPLIEPVALDNQKCEALSANFPALRCGQELPLDQSNPEHLSDVTKTTLRCMSNNCSHLGESYACIKSGTLEDCPSSLTVTSDISCGCVTTNCSQIAFVPYAGDRYIKDCGSYTNLDMCRTNSCFGQDYRFGSAPLNEVCLVVGNKCENLRHQTCDTNTDCQIANNPDSRTWCCEDIWAAPDRCRPIGGEGGIDADKCKN